MRKRAATAGRTALCIFTLCALMLGSTAASAAPAPAAKDPNPTPGAPPTVAKPAPRPATRPRVAPPAKKRRTATPRAARPAESDPDETAPPEGDTPYGDKDVDDEGKAKTKPHVVKTKVKMELSLGFLYDDNAALGRRGQFGADQVYDVAAVLGVDSRLQTDILRTLRFVLTGKLRSEEGRWRQYLRNTDVSLKPGFELDLSKNMTLSTSMNFKLHRETQEVWGYLEAAPSLMFILYTKLGLIFEASFDYTNTSYDSDILTNTYANTDRESLLGKLRFKLWQTQKIRWALKLEAEHQIFDDNIDEKLGHIMFADIDDFEDPDLEVDPYKRRDTFLRAELEFLMLPRKDFAFALGYRFEMDKSNLDAFNTRAHGPRVALVYIYKKYLQVYGEARVSFYDFYNFRYDTRFTNTRKDIKLEGFATVQAMPKEWLKIGLKVTFLSNFSNDARKDDNNVPYFDPRHSRSYSRYQGTRIELTTTFLWDTQSGKTVAPPKPEPRLPGTIMAQR